MTPNLREEKKLRRKGYKKIVGLDEVGRGALAGPVVAAAVMIRISNLEPQNSKPNSKTQILKEIKDSKKLSQKQREKFYEILITHSGVLWGIGKVSEKVIDRINIKNAAELAMEKALINLEKKVGKVDFLIIDGNHLNNRRLKTINHRLIVRADEKVFSCAAASILAKVTRDKIMKNYHKKYPLYAFDRHKGYSTELHLKNISRYKPSPIHRQTFRPMFLYG
ncbi:MAG: ribonuclease HII, ribonuclease HII [Parcubacteria group bacterium GW2011_GWC1_38_6]|nr:MAG: ribonuclease HII, ribonuclease HII [Parcubacteria group bacterium GW2011_GWC1_38_6]